MEIIGTIVTTILGGVCSCISTQVTEQFHYVKSPTKELDTLHDKVETLVARMKDVESRLRSVEKKPGKTCTYEVQDWLSKVRKLNVEVEGLEQKAKETRRCLNYLNCQLRLKLGKTVARLIKDAEFLDKKFPNEALTNLVPKIGMEMVAPKIIGETTAVKNMEAVWVCIMDNEVSKIGVWGMGGVGKTTVMKNINNRLLEQCDRFNKVIWVTVSKDANVYKLQDAIANDIDHPLSTEQDEAKRSASLFGALNRSGKIVLILDDMWEAFPLDKIGIPEPNEANGFKLILTTRSLEVCRKMGCQNNIHMKVLSEDEAWELFRKKTSGNHVPEKSDGLPLAKAIVKECAGLPLAIITIGVAMSGKDDIREWRVALNDLQASSSLIPEMEEDVFKCLQFSYNELKDDILQKCFLYCALYPEDWKINSRELIDLWVMEGLIKGKNMEDEKDRGHVILIKLKRCCLLESVDYSEDVKMHDLVREMALSLTKTTFMVKASAGLTMLANKAEWEEDLERVSFVGSEIRKISVSPKCHGLTTLLCTGKYNHPLNYIAPDFFVHMECLRVLNLRNTAIELLPDSISELVSLRGLLLGSCDNLKRVPSLAKLKSLEVLDLKETAIEELPDGMKMLLNLKRFILSTVKNLREPVPAGLISNWSSLQVLDLDRTPVDMVYSPGRVAGFVKEVLSLTQLETLKIEFRELSDFISYIQSSNFKGLKQFFFQVEGSGRWYRYEEINTVRIYNNKTGIPHNELSLPHNTRLLHIAEFHDLARLLQLACLKGMNDLIDCLISRCNTMECILSAEDEKEQVEASLHSLEELTILRCPKLSSIYKGGVASKHGVLTCLKKLHIYHCANLKNLFSAKIMQQLQNLEWLQVRQCYEMEELITGPDEDDVISAEQGICPRLAHLSLEQLPKLKGAALTRVLMFSNSWEYVRLIKCHGLKTVFSTGLLPHLQWIDIEDCEEMEEVIVSEEENNTTQLPQLSRLELSQLPKLKGICSGVMVCDSLQYITIEKCCNLKRLPQFRASGLREIEAEKEWWDSLEWDHPDDRNLLQPFFIPSDGDGEDDNAPSASKDEDEEEVEEEEEETFKRIRRNNDDKAEGEEIEEEADDKPIQKRRGRWRRRRRQ